MARQIATIQNKTANSTYSVRYPGSTGRYPSLDCRGCGPLNAYDSTPFIQFRLGVFSEIRRGRYPVFDMLENLPDFAGSLDGSRKLLVKLGSVHVYLGQSKNLFGQLGRRTIRVFVRDEQQGPGHAQPRIGPVTGNTPARVEQALALQVHECAPQHGIIAVTKHPNRRAFLYPEQIAQINSQALERGIDALSLFRLEA